MQFKRGFISLRDARRPNSRNSQVFIMFGETRA